MSPRHEPGRSRLGYALPPSAWLQPHPQGGHEFCRHRGSILLSLDRLHEVGPVVYPRCGAEMRIVAFSRDSEVIDTILRHLACTEAEHARDPSGHRRGEDTPQRG